MLAQRVKIKDKQIKAVKNLPKPTSVRNIELFIGFANFYQRFIWDFNRIVVLLTFLLKTIVLLKLALKAFKADNNKVVSDDSSRDNETVVNLSKKKNLENQYIYQILEL